MPCSKRKAPEKAEVPVSRQKTLFPCMTPVEATKKLFDVFADQCFCTHPRYLKGEAGFVNAEDNEPMYDEKTYWGLEEGLRTILEFVPGVVKHVTKYLPDNDNISHHQWEDAWSSTTQDEDSPIAPCTSQSIHAYDGWNVHSNVCFMKMPMRDYDFEGDLNTLIDLELTEAVQAGKADIVVKHNNFMAAFVPNREENEDISINWVRTAKLQCKDPRTKPFTKEMLDDHRAIFSKLMYKANQELTVKGRSVTIKIQDFDIEVNIDQYGICRAADMAANKFPTFEDVVDAAYKAIQARFDQGRGAATLYGVEVYGHKLDFVYDESFCGQNTKLDLTYINLNRLLQYCYENDKEAYLHACDELYDLWKRAYVNVISPAIRVKFPELEEEDEAMLETLVLRRSLKEERDRIRRLEEENKYLRAKLRKLEESDTNTNRGCSANKSCLQVAAKTRAGLCARLLWEKCYRSDALQCFSK